MTRHHHEIHQRDNDGLFDVVCGGIVSGPFPSWAFAQRVASGEKPAPIEIVGGKFRRCRIVREVANASA